MSETASSSTSPASTRRHLLGYAAAGALAGVPVLAAASTAQAATPSAAGEARVPHDLELVYVGAWQGTQIFAAWFDPQAGTFDLIGPVADLTSNWTTRHPHLPMLYVAGNDLGGSVTPFAVDQKTGALSAAGAALATAPANTASGGLAYIGIDAPSETLLVANFAAGLTAAAPIAKDGSLGTSLSTVQDTGSGPNARQAGPHVHDAVVSPEGRYVLTPDFGADRVFILRFDRERHTVSATDVPPPKSYATAAGSGPRRIVFHPNGRVAYLLSELTASIETLDWDPDRASLTQRQILSTDSADFTGTKSGAELTISADGRFVYASNRGENTLVVYATDPRTGDLTLVQRTACGGTSPWSFTLHSSGRWLLVANLVSDTVNVFAVDPATGQVTDTGSSVAIPSADCITVVANLQH